MVTNRRWHAITRLIQKHGYTKGAELGVWDARCFKHLVNVNKNLHMIGVDLYQAQPDNPGPEKWTPGENGHMWAHDEYFADVMKFCEQHPERTTFIRDYTTEAAKLVEDDSLDFIFIDADHSEAGVRGDIDSWTPKVRSGGMIIGHDINWPSVLKVVKEYYGEERKGWFKSDDNVWYTQKV